jgi:hypothetical protein
LDTRANPGSRARVELSANLKKPSFTTLPLSGKYDFCPKKEPHFAISSYPRSGKSALRWQEQKTSVKLHL